MQRILYLGSFLDESIVAERGLCSHNAAGSNRMKRLSKALRVAGFRPIVLSAATSMRAYAPGGPLRHPARVRRIDGMAVVYAPSLNLMLLGAMTTFFFQFAVTRRVLRRPLEGIVVYNFAPSLVFLSLWLALKPGIRIVNNVEDVSVPRREDWSSTTDARPVQQLVFWLCMNLVGRLSDAYIVPSRRFLPYLHARPTEVVTGCIGIPPLPDAPPLVPPLRVLYAGKIEREHGIMQFVDALLMLDLLPVAERISVDISGAGSMTDLVAEKLKALTKLQARLQGFMSTTKYARLLNDAQVCVALQDPQGRYANFKTPSKIYEFLGFGKAVIATDVGDIRELPEDTLIVLDRLDATAIADRIAALAEDSDRTRTLQRRARDYALAEFAYENVGKRLKRLFNNND